MNVPMIIMISFLFGVSYCLENFTKVGNSEIFIVEKRLPFDKAEKRCKEMGSNLIEFWSEEEWKQVISEKFVLLRPSHVYYNFSLLFGQGRETLLIELDSNMDFGLDWLIEVQNITKYGIFL